MNRFIADRRNWKVASPYWHEQSFIAGVEINIFTKNRVSSKLQATPSFVFFCCFFFSPSYYATQCQRRHCAFCVAQLIYCIERRWLYNSQQLWYSQCFLCRDFPSGNIRGKPRVRLQFVPSFNCSFAAQPVDNSHSVAMAWLGAALRCLQCPNLVKAPFKFAVAVSPIEINRYQVAQALTLARVYS